MTKIAINGFGRIGRGFLRAAHDHSDIEIVAINDLGALENLTYLLKYDTVYGRAKFDVTAGDKAIIVDGTTIPVFAEKEIANLPWRNVGADIVVESTGLFTDAEKAKAHLTAGAKRVVITAPGKGEGVETILIGANEDKFGTSEITSNASCTTNAASPLIGILLESIGIEPEVPLTFRLADGRTLERQLGMAIVHVEGRKAPDWVVFAEPGDAVLLGAHSLEGLNYRVDPRAKRFVDAGPVITASAA